eukprot:1150431-Pelagomonas_calceolata.AAC.3
MSPAADKNADASQPQDPNGASQAKHPARTESEERSDGSAEWEQPPQQQQQQPQLPPQQQQQSTAAVAEAAAVAAGAAAAAASAAEAAPVRFDGELALVRSLVEKVVLELITGVKSTAEVKRSLLAHAVRQEQGDAGSFVCFCDICLCLCARMTLASLPESRACP